MIMFLYQFINLMFEKIFLKVFLLLFYVLEYCDKFYFIFKLLGLFQRFIDFNVDCFYLVIILWRFGFDGGVIQDFMIEYLDNLLYWLIYYLQLVVFVDNNFMLVQIYDICLNILYLF